MRIGDNIEDIGGVTQEGANPVELLEGWGKDFFLLPNPSTRFPSASGA